MKTQLLTAVSALALVSAPAFADNMRNDTNTAPQAQQQDTLGQNIEQGWDKTKKEATEAANTVADETSEAYNEASRETKEAYKAVSKEAKEAYKNAKSELSGNNDVDVRSINIESRMTAKGMLGEAVYNLQGERIAKVRDIILDDNGDAMMVVLGDGDFTGLGKLVAFDYSAVTERKPNGDVITSLSESVIDTAATFSYDRNDNRTGVRVVPSNGYSVAEILDANITDNQGQSLAEVDNIAFRNGKAANIVVAFGQVLGMGGERAIMSFNDPELTRQQNGLALKLSATEAAKFEAYKQTALN